MLLVLIIVMFGSYDSDYQPYVCLCFCLLGDINIDDIQWFSNLITIDATCETHKNHETLAFWFMFVSLLYLFF